MLQPVLGAARLVTEGRDADCRYRHSPHDRRRDDRRRAAAEIRRRRPRHGRRRRLHVEPRHRQSADAHDGDTGGRLLPDQPVSVLATRATTASRASILGSQPASQSQPAGGATPIAPPTSGGILDSLKKADEQQQPAGAIGPAGAAVAIKQGGHAGRQLPSCISNLHQDTDNALIFTSPTAPQNVRRGLRFVLANRLGGLKG